MLGKLIKHEFRATGRIMLPMMGALLALAVLANLSIQGLAGSLSDIPALRMLFTLILVFFGVGMVATAVMTVVIMVSRFYRNLLKSEGYLMFTLPVSVHEIIWSKLIVSLVWFLAVALLVILITGLSALWQSGTNLEMIFSELPSWAEIRQELEEMGIWGQLWSAGIWMVVVILLGGLVSCLHFYASMALGHMFAKNKILLSVLFFIAISFAFDMMEMGYGMALPETESIVYYDSEAAKDGFQFLSRILMHACIIELIQGAVLYLSTALGLKNGLNLE